MRGFDSPDGESSRPESPGSGRYPAVTRFVLINVVSVSRDTHATHVLSHRGKVRYSFVVKTTETVSRADPAIADGDDADQLIIQRVLAGHRDAFRVLISRYSDPLYRHALCMTGSPDVAEDILQMSFIKAYQHLADDGLVEKRRGLGMFINTGARDLLLESERARFLAEQWPAIHATIQRLGLTPGELLAAAEAGARAAQTTEEG